MKTTYQNAYIRVWFNSLSTSKNFYNVTEIIKEGNLALIKSNGMQNLINWDNVNLIEELEVK